MIERLGRGKVQWETKLVMVSLYENWSRMSDVCIAVCFEQLLVIALNT